MSDYLLPDEIKDEAEKFNGRGNDQKDVDSTETEQTDEQVEALILESLSSATTLTELSDLVLIRGSNPAFGKGLKALGIDYRNFSEGLLEMARETRKGKIDPDLAAKDQTVPLFLRDMVRRVTKTEISRLAEEREQTRLADYRYSELGRLLNGEDTSESSLKSALFMLNALGEYKGPFNKEKPYTMQELHDAVMEVIKKAENATNTVTVERAIQRLQDQLPTLKGNALVFFARAVTLHATHYKRGRVDSLVSN